MQGSFSDIKLFQDNRALLLILKKYGYLLVMLTPLFLVVAQLLWVNFGYADLFAFAPLFFIFGLMPPIDHLVGKDSNNLDVTEQAQSPQQQEFYTLITLLSVPLHLGILFYAAYVFFTADLSWIGQLGWLISTGTVSGIYAFTNGHELVHKDSKLEQWAGGFLLASVCYGGFKVEHLRGHHVDVCTPADASSAPYGQSIYNFLPRAYIRNFFKAWHLEAERLQSRGLATLVWQNQLIWLTAMSLTLMVLFTFLWGWMGLVFFLVQSFIAFSLDEIINYVGHYGLRREKLANGRYERPNIYHSWNSNYLLTNLFLLQMPRHPDHHASPKRSYQLLQHYDDSPQLPSGYAGMIILALIPPLWFRVMNPRIDKFYQQDVSSRLIKCL